MNSEVLISVVQSIFSAKTLLLMITGVIVGSFFGAMPGLNGSVACALLLSFTYGMSAVQALLMLGGIYMGASYGGSISAILLNVPGTGEAACTALDGYPLALKGRANEALSYSAIASSFGGVIGVLALIFFTPVLAKMSLKFGPAEMLVVSFLGICIVGGIVGKSPARGIISIGIGILISTVGMDSMQIGVKRLTFGIPKLSAGIQMVPVMVGLFAVTEMLMLTCSKKGSLVDCPQIPCKPAAAFREMAKHKLLLLKSAFIGTIIGILPGTGGAIAAFVSYGEARRTDRDPASFGSGNIRGILAAESANNGAVGGSFVPLLALAIPGSPTAAIIMGALTIHGLEPGPAFISSEPVLAYSFMIGMLLTIPVLYCVGVFGKTVFSRVLSININYLIVTVLVCASIGCYSIRHSFLDIFVMLFFGFIGVFFKKAKIAIPPIAIGIVLGPLIEQNLRRSLTISSAQNVSLIEYIITKPICIVLIAAFALIIYANIKSGKIANRTQKTVKADNTGAEES